MTLRKERGGLRRKKVTDAVRWSHFQRDEVVVNNNGTCFIVLSVNGPSYESIATSVARDISERRKQALLDLAGKPIAAQFRTIHRTATIPPAPSFPGVLGELNDSWRNALSHTYETRHYLTLIAEDANTAATLESEANAFIQKCPEFSPRILTNIADDNGVSELASYLYELLNGVPAAIAPVEGDIAETLTVSHIEPEISGFIRQSVNLNPRYTAAVTVTGYGGETEGNTLSELLALNCDFETVVTTRILSQGKAQHVCEYRAKQSGLRLKNPIIDEQWESTANEIHAGNETLTETTFQVFPAADSQAALRSAVNRISGVLASNNWRPFTEEILAFRAFMSRWPGTNFTDRPRNLRTVNVVDLTPLSGTEKGNSTSLWGPRPIRYIPTAGAQTPYALTYHPTPGDDSSPHDIIIAGTRSGKTVFDTFRGAGAHTAHTDLRQIYFDRNGGMKVFTAYHDGQYLTPENPDMAMNPFDTIASPETRAILERLISIMTQLDDANTLKVIQQAVKDAQFEGGGGSPVTLAGFYQNFVDPGPVRDALRPWIENERYKAIFGGVRDAFDPNAARISTIALDTIVDDARLAGVFAYYILARIQTAFVANGYPYRITVDEASTLLQQPSVANLIVSEIRTAAKNRGQVTTIWQDFASIHQNAIGDALLSNAGTLYIWPGTAESPEECDALGSFRFTDTERQFVMGQWRPARSTRPILLKRHETSVFLETDLSRLGPYLRIFQGGWEHNREFAKCRKTHPSAWRSSFLQWQFSPQAEAEPVSP
jgi:type IV secretory pathway VirB4 component